MAESGTLAEWKDDKGFGFVSSPGGGKVFVHIRAFARASRRPRVGDRLVFDIDASSPKGPRAVNVRFVEDAGRAHGRRFDLSLALAATYLVALSIGIALQRVPWILLALVLIASVVTFIIYAIDKAHAQRGDQRVPEDTLHLLALVGGWPGAAVAQQWLRHKSVKRSFRSAYYVSIGVNLAAVALVLRPDWRAALITWLGNLAG